MTVNEDDIQEFLIDKMLTAIVSAGDYQASYNEKAPDYQDLEKEYLILRSISLKTYPGLCGPGDFGHDFNQEIEKYIKDAY